MTALATLLVVLALSLLVTRVATVALTLTGLSKEAARFQARSAFTGAGFTTSESELVVKHPVRRRIVMTLMLLGNAGVVAAVGSLLLTFIETGEPTNWGLRLGVLAAGLVTLWLLATSRYVDRLVSHVTTRALRRWTSIDVTDYAELLHLAGEHKVVVLPIEKGHWADGRTLADLNLRAEGMLTLGVERRDGTFLGAPPLDTRINAGDQMTIYGRSPAIDALGDRRASDVAGEEHAHAEQIERRRVAEVRRTDPER
ncbi:MAG TPA: TrkA C-terminal domain-containing protein [Candidatus Limnocylindrales bacterium]|nr:TrkA C-terminal domain-containing protein [Candidatus Limnocylindrales bacterium]